MIWKEYFHIKLELTIHSSCNQRAKNHFICKDEKEEFIGCMVMLMMRERRMKKTRIFFAYKCVFV